MDDLKSISKRRKKAGMNQTELARLAGVSQSLIAKMERGMIDISYSKALRIFAALDSVERKERISVKKIMTKKILSIGKNNKAVHAAEIMEKNGISQLPVLESGRCVGSVGEGKILETMRERGARGLKTMLVKEIMEDSFPAIPAKSYVGEAGALLKENDAVLVVENGSIKGIITKADLIKTLV